METIVYKQFSTFWGYQILLTNTTGSKTLIGATIKMDFRPKTKDAAIAFSLSTGNGITVINATTAEIDKQKLPTNLEDDTYYSDVHIDFADGDTDNETEVKFIIKKAVTND